jgi:hypothetical protein
MLNQSPRLRTFVAAFTLVFVLSLASTNLAQSGRKGRKSDPVPVATPEPEPSPPPDVSSAKTKPRFTFLVGLDRNDTFSNLPMYAYEGVLRSLIGRLEDSPVVKVAASQSNMGRGEAIKNARAESEAYVIFLQLGLDSLSMSGQSSGNYDVIIEYSVLAPVTAKQLTYGRTYTQAQRRRGGILTPPTSSVYGDRYLNLAAQEAADKILAYFRSHGPSTPPPRKP